MTVEPVTPAKPMRRTALVWACWACALLSGFAGCRTARDNQIDILERELRTQEDYIYELEDYVCQYSERLRQYRCAEPMVVGETVKPTSIVKKNKPKPTPANLDEPLQMDEEPFDELENELPAPTRRTTPSAPVTPQETSPENLEAPELEIGAPVGQMDHDARALRAVYTENEPYEASENVSALPPVVDTEPFEVDEQVETVAYEAEGDRMPEQVVVTHLFRGSEENDAPATLLAVVEARDANDEPIEVDGEVSLMVMTADAKKPVRLKRWDFTAEDAASAWQSSHLGDGLHLELPLEETELPDAPLELWVRVVAPDGSKLLTQLPFDNGMLTALDSETGPGEEQLAQQVSDNESHEPEGRLLSAEEPVVDKAGSQAGWKPSLVRSDAASTGSAGKTAKASGWTAQPPGGRFPGVQPAVTEFSTKQPIWTAGRTQPVSSTPTRRSAQPQWSPFR